MDYEYTQVIVEATNLDLDLFDSLCTIQQPDGTLGPSGAPSGTFIDVAGLIAIPCIDAVPSTARVQATEVKALADIMSKGLRHLLLNGYYPQIQSNWRANVDGVLYDILGVENDSQSTQTRLEMQLVTL